jgi:hypothetical protein
MRRVKECLKYWVIAGSLTCVVVGRTYSIASRRPQLNMIGVASKLEQPFRRSLTHLYL